MITTSRFFFDVIIFLLFLSFVSISFANEISLSKSDDPHESPVGFWDIHVCNWPDRPPFYLTLFKTEYYDQIEKIEVISPDGANIGEFKMEKFLEFDRPEKNPLRVLITHLPLHPDQPEGWFTAHISTADGQKYIVRDYLIMRLMEQADDLVPAPDSIVEVPWELSWSPVSGANFYRVWIRDLWNDGKQIYKSDLLSEPRLELPEEILQPGGYYSWRIHSRDTDSHILLGDFNHGSLTKWMEFTIEEE